MKYLYFEDLYKDFREHTGFCILFVAICIAIGGIAGFAASKHLGELTEKQQEKLESYQQEQINYERNLAAYDTRIETGKESLELLQKNLDQMQQYTDTAVLMKLDPDSVPVLSFEATLQMTGGGSTDVVYQSVQNLLNQGRLYQGLEGVAETGSFNDVLSVSLNGNIMTFVFLYPDAQKGRKILWKIRRNLGEALPQIAAAQGWFTAPLSEVREEIRADETVQNRQNEIRTAMERTQQQVQDKTDAITRLEEEAEAYREESKPKEPEILSYRKANSKKELMLRHLISGAGVGILLLLFYEMIKYSFPWKINHAEDLAELGIPILGEIKKGSFVPEAERICMELSVKTAAYQAATAFCVPANWNEGLIEQTAGVLLSEMRKAGMKEAVILQEYNGKDQKVLAGCDNCVVFVKKRESEIISLKELQQFCRKFQVNISGCILAE